MNKTINRIEQADETNLTNQDHILATIFFKQLY